MAFQWKKARTLGFWAAAVSVILSLVIKYIAPLLNLDVTMNNLFSINLISTFSSVGQFFANAFGTYTGFDFVGLLIIALGGFLTAIVGLWLLEKLKLDGKIKSKFWKIFFAYLLGSVAWYILAVGFVMQAWATIGGVVLFHLITAFIISLFAKDI